MRPVLLPILALTLPPLLLLGLGTGYAIWEWHLEPQLWGIVAEDAARHVEHFTDGR